MKEENKCKTCRHWKNEQSELGYYKGEGICTCFKWKFNSNSDGDVMVLDRQNRADNDKGTRRFENQNHTIPIGQIEKSRYCFVTDENFGCIHHHAKETKKT